MTIRIDVPGIGTVVAENAATESTLRELVRLMGGRGAGNNTRTTVNRRNDPSGVFDNIIAAGKKLIDTTNALSKATIRLVDDFSNLGNSISSAADVTASALNKIPIVGEALGMAFKATAKSAEDLANAFQSSASAGADFGGSVNSMARSASQAGMTIDQFAQLIQSNNGSLLGFSNNSATGAKRFAEISKRLRSTSDELYAFGLSTTEINQGLMAYGDTLRLQGLNENRSNRELLEGSRQYLKEMDLLAKVTGEERRAKQEERKRLLQDGQIQAALSQMDEKARNSFMRLMQTIPAPLQGYVKDVLATGTVSRQENKLFGSQMGETTALLSSLHGKLMRQEELTIEENQLLLNTLKAESKYFSSIGMAVAANESLSHAAGQFTAAQGIQTNGLLSAAQAQEKSKRQTDLFNKQVENAKEGIAALSNNFKEALANSGLLPKLMNFFNMLSDIVVKYVLPAFSNYLVPALEKITDFLVDLLTPAFEVLGEVFSDIMPGVGESFTFLDSVLESVRGAFTDIGRGLMNLFSTVGKGTNIIEKISNAFKTAGEIFVGGIEFIGRFIENLTNSFTDFLKYIGEIGAQSAGLSRGFSMAKDAVEDFTGFLKMMLSREGADFVFMALGEFFTVILPDIAYDIKDWFENMLLDMQVLINEYLGIFGKGIPKAEADRIKAERKKADEARNLDRKISENKIDAAYNDLKFQAAQREMQKKDAKTSKKIYDQSAKMAGDTLKNTAKAISLNTTTSAGTIETLKQFAEQQGKTSSFKNADAAKETIGEATKEAVKESAPPPVPEKTAPGTSTTNTGRIMEANNQTTPGTAPNQLNTVMAELVELMRQNNMQNRQMMSKMASLSGNLYEG